ncbi:unnamed protein product [Symbiodinium sp. CCMP2592]|nr:unnamed protein product [Symbiodinium sp. CCMP2592]
MASLDTKSLAQAICHENELAVEKSALIEGRDVVLFVGCCGSGKTTVASYVQGTKFKYSRGKLEEETKLEGFAIGDQRADVTQGLAFAEVPETEGLWLADSAGTGATSGVHAEVFGALNRSAVLQKARSVRLVLVIKEGRFDVGNERGRLVVKDIEHVASMFVDLSVNDNLKSVGVIVTSDPRGLQADGVAADIVSSMNDSLKQLHGQAVVDDGFVIVGDSSKASGMRTSSAGKWLMHHICENCNRAAQTVEEMDGTDDEAILRGLCSARIAVFPFNMLREGHRFYLKMWLRGLKPVEQPATSLTSALPAEARALLESHVSDSFIKYKKLIADHSGVWTRKEMLVPEIIDVVNLTFVLEESRLLPSVEKFRTDLGNQLLQENRNALVHLLAAVRGGAPAKAADPWSALLSMDGFRQQCSRITLEGWTSSTAALEECLDAAKESFAKYLPDGFASARWDSNLALQVSGIFECVRQLQPGSSDLLRMWALALLDHVRSLQSKSAECASATGTAQALARLEEHRDFLPDMVIPALCKYGCEALQGEALHQIVQESKDAVRQQLQRLSAQVVEETPSDGKPVLLEKLQHLCRSDELNRLLEDDLEQAYVVKPLCSKLAPQQEEIDNLEEQIRNSEPEQWRIALLDLSQRVAATADLAKMILHSKDLKWTGLLEAVSQHITSQKAVAISAVPKLASLSGCERQWAVVSNSGSGTGYDSDEGEVDKESGDLLEGTVEELCELVAVDTLFHLLGRRSDTAASALVAVGWSLKQSLNQALKRANRARDKSWVPSSSLSTATLFAMHSLNGLAKAAQTTIGPLKELQDVPVHGLPQALEKCISEARAFVDGFLQTEMGDWNDATTGAMGWPDLFSRHVKMANKLRGLATKDMRDAAQKLYQKVYDWHKHQLSEAQRAVCPAETSSGEAGTDDSWQIFLKHGVREGLAFEQTRLCRELDFKVQFRPLVAKQVEMCQTEAASAQPTERLRVWRNMTQLIQELQQVQGDDPQLCRFTEILLAARTPLDTDLGDTSSDFEKALNEKRYARAAELLLKVQKRQRHAEILHQHINDDFAITMKLLDSDHEGEATRAGQEARRLLQEVQLIEEAETKNTVQKRTEELTSKLERKMNEAQQQLQLALEGRRPPLPALSVCVALSGNSKMKTAIEAVNKFCANKKDMFLQMNTSELLSWMAKHDGVWRAMPDEMRR